MKAKRFLSVFFLLALLVNLAALPAAAAEVPEDPEIQAKAAPADGRQYRRGGLCQK